MGHVWVKHKETGGTWHAPADWLEQFPEEAAGWEPCEAPVEVNPAVAERLAWLAEQAAEKSKPTKAASRGKSADE